VYRTIKQAIMQLYPGEPEGSTARMLTTLAALVIGIVQGKNCQLPAVAPKRQIGSNLISVPNAWFTKESCGPVTALA
jgi:hypothetical protein